MEERQLPGGIIGNGRMLAVIAPDGQPQKLFWPHIDWGQHLGFWKLGLQRGTEPPFWLEGSGHQSYENNTLITKLDWEHPYQVSLKDDIAPEQDLWLRSLEIRNLSAEQVNLKLVIYVAFKIDDSELADGMYLETNYLVQHKRQTFLGLAVPNYPLLAYGCGRQGSASDPWLELQKGRISGLKDNIRGGAAALSWDLGSFASGEKKIAEVFLAAAPNPYCLKDLLLTQSGAELHQKSQAFWQNWLQSAKSLDFPLYNRSLLTLKLLTDAEKGGSLAAPEFDPYFEHSGGYGYCWPRDGFFVALAFEEAGFKEEAAAFYEFMRQVQCPSGDWQQRYWLDGSWASHWGRQTDQTGAILWGYNHHYQSTKDPEFLKQIWPSVLRGAEFLRQQMASNNLPQAAVDLWEDTFEQNTYTAAAVWGGLQGAVALAKACQETAWSELWQETADQLKQAILEELPNQQGVFTRALGNPILDSAAVGLIYPFGVLEAKETTAQKTLAALAQHLTNSQVGGLYRYQWDRYVGGNPWVVSTLWLTIGLAKQGQREEAAALIKWAEEHASPTGLLPEQIDPVEGKPFWVLPLAWSHALYILACLAVTELD